MRMYKKVGTLYITIHTELSLSSYSAPQRRKKKKRTKRGLARRLYCYFHAYDAILIILFYSSPQQ